MRFSADPVPCPLLVRASSIRTLSDEGGSPVAFLVEDGYVQRVLQSNDAASQLAEQKSISTIDRPGCCVLPAFSDAHTHLKFLGESLLEPDLSSCSSYEDIRATLVDWVNEHSLSKGELIHGRGWNPDQMTEQRWPHRSDLDHPALSEHPVALLSHDHHAYWVNDTFLNEFPNTRSLSTTSGGTIRTDENGNRTGVFLESAIEPVTELVDQKQKHRDTSSLLRGAIKELVRNGITCVHDIGDYESLDAHQTLQSSYELLPEVCFFCFQGSWDQIPPDLRSPGRVTNGLEFAGMKLFADGTLGAQTAALLEPYRDRIDAPSSRGELVNDPETLTKHAVEAAEQQFSTTIHAIGDRAVRISLDVLSSVYDDASPAYPPRIEHAQLVSNQDRSRFSDHGVVSSMQPCHYFQDQSIADRALGKRADELFPLQSLKKNGTSILFGSDAPIEPPDPLRNLQSAVYRAPKAGPHPESGQHISLTDALTFSCQSPRSYLNHSPVRGKITSGVPADFVVLSDDPLSYTSGPLTDLRVLETFIDGQRVYSS